MARKRVLWPLEWGGPHRRRMLYRTLRQRMRGAERSVEAWKEALGVIRLERPEYFAPDYFEVGGEGCEVVCVKRGVIELLTRELPTFQVVSSNYLNKRVVVTLFPNAIIKHACLIMGINFTFHVKEWTRRKIASAKKREKKIQSGLTTG